MMSSTMNNRPKSLKWNYILSLFLACVGCGGGESEGVSASPNNTQNASENSTPTVSKAIYLFSVPDSVSGAYFTIDGTDTNGDMSGLKVELGMNTADKCQSSGNIVPDCRLSIKGPLGGSLDANLKLVFSKLENLDKIGTAYYEFIFNKYKVRVENCFVNGIGPEYEISGQLYCELNFSHTYSRSEFQEERSVHGFCTTDRNVEKALGFNLGGKYHYISYQQKHDVDIVSQSGGPGATAISIGTQEILGSSYKSSTMTFDNKDQYNYAYGDLNFNSCVWLDE